MNVEAILDLVWALAAVSGAAWLVCRPESRRVGRVPFAHAIAVFLVILCLFPAISASDDALRMELLQSRMIGESAGCLTDTGRLHLAHLLDSLDEFRLSACLSLLVAWRFLSVVLARRESRQDCLPPQACGRAPPCLA